MTQTSSKREAQQRVDRLHTFRQQLEELLGLGVFDLPAEQHSRLNSYLDKTLAELAERYDVDISDRQKQISLGMRILSALGGLAFCAALYLFFYRIWGSLTTPPQMAILIATPILALAAMDFISRREKTYYYTTLASLVVITSFAINLGVMGSLFNIMPSPGIFLACGAFAVALAYSYRLRLALAAGLVALLIFAAATITTWDGSYWVTFLQRPESLLPGCMALLAVPLVVRHSKFVDFPEVYRWVGLLLLLFCLELLIHAGHTSYFPLGAKTIESMYRIAGFIVAGLVIFWGIRKSYPDFVNLGSLFFALYLFDQIFSWWWDWMPKYLFFLIIGLIAACLLAVFRKIRNRVQEQVS
jgi:uncharacterized membrane protein